jgi:hypothetical protein
MGRLAADDAAQRDEAVEGAPARRRLLRLDRHGDGGGNLEGAGDREPLMAGARPLQCWTAPFSISSAISA